MENLVLVPEREFREFNNWKSKRGANDSGILQAIRNPEQRQMVQKWYAKDKGATIEKEMMEIVMQMTCDLN